MQSPLTPSAGLTEKLFEELLTELRTERSSMREQHQGLVRERKTERHIQGAPQRLVAFRLTYSSTFCLTQSAR